MNAESIIEELENICYNNEYILELLSKLKNSIPICPLPCVRDEHGEIKEQTVKQLFQKINEELDELKEAIYKNRFSRSVAEEAADVKTAITTLEEALDIDAAMRDEAIRRVNAKNRERGRLA